MSFIRVIKSRRMRLAKRTDSRVAHVLYSTAGIGGSNLTRGMEWELELGMLYAFM